MELDEKYTLDWFKKRALSSLKQIEPHAWDFSDSLLLYVNSGDDEYEALQETDTPYFNLVTKPEREYLSAIAEEVVKELPDAFEYIDLGPGTEHKEQYFFNELKKQQKKFTYIPVDISEHYLCLSNQFATAQGISVKTVQSSFEELSDRLGEKTVVRFVSLGLTFSNYDPRILIPMLQDIAGKDGVVFVEAQMRDRIDLSELAKTYERDTSHIARQKVALLGLDPKTDISECIVDDGIRLWCTVLKTNPMLDEKGIVIDDKLLLLQSLRYTKESFEKTLIDSHADFTLLDNGSSFIAALIRT